MEIRSFLYFALFCVAAWSAVASGTEKIPGVDEINEFTNFATHQDDGKNRNVENSKIEEQVLPDRKGVSRPGIDEKNIGCSRYCIQKRFTNSEAGIDSVKRVNIIWRIVNDSRVTFTGETSWGMSESRDKEFRWEPSRITLEDPLIFGDTEAKCELFLDLGCRARSEAEIGEHAIVDEDTLSELEHLGSMTDAEGFRAIEFNVREGTEKLRIFVEGKLSQAILEIPIAPREDSTNARKPRPTLTLWRTSNARGVHLDTRDPPPGEWRLKLLGVENSNYTFDVVATSPRKFVNNTGTRDPESPKTSSKDLTENIQHEAIETSDGFLPSQPQLSHLSSSSSSSSSSSTRKNKTARAIIFNDEQLSEEISEDMPEGFEPWTTKQFATAVEVPGSSETKTAAQFSTQPNLDVEIMQPAKKGKILTGISFDGANETARILENSELGEFSGGIEDGLTGVRKTVVDVHPNAKLVARPGSPHVILFTVKNNQATTMPYRVVVHSTHYTIVNVRPSPVVWIGPGAVANIEVQIAVPNGQDTLPNILSLSVTGGENPEVVKKSTYIYVEGASGVTTTDNYKPSIDYTFNDNCAGKLNRERCFRSRWSVEITAKYPDSGLKRIVSQPEGIEPRSQFIAGTKNSVNFYYSASCCHTSVDVTTIDIQGNIYTRRIDVTEWNNLNQGEIAAVVLGAFLILILLIFIILVILFCIRRKKSHDLSYSQRYGSRTPASAERTNF